MVQETKAMRSTENASINFYGVCLSSKLLKAFTNEFALSIQ